MSRSKDDPIVEMEEAGQGRIRCAHCGGELLVLLPTDNIEAVERRRDTLVDAVGDLIRATSGAIGSVVVLNPADGTPVPE